MPPEIRSEWYGAPKVINVSPVIVSLNISDSSDWAVYLCWTNSIDVVILSISSFIETILSFPKTDLIVLSKGFIAMHSFLLQSTIPPAENITFCKASLFDCISINPVIVLFPIVLSN